MTKASKPRAAKLSVGDVVRVVFDDLGEGRQHIVFEAFVRVTAKRKREVVVASWKYAESDELDENTVEYTILRAAIRSLDVLLPSIGQESADKTA